MNTDKCPTCGAPAKMTWSGLDLVANTGDETLATKHYEYDSERIAQLEEALKMITKGAEMASHEFDDPNDATEAFSYLNICIEKAKSLLK